MSVLSCRWGPSCSQLSYICGEEKESPSRRAWRNLDLNKTTAGSCFVLRMYEIIWWSTIFYCLCSCFCSQGKPGITPLFSSLMTEQAENCSDRENFWRRNILKCTYPAPGPHSKMSEEPGFWAKCSIKKKEKKGKTKALSSLYLLSLEWWW